MSKVTQLKRLRKADRKEILHRNPGLLGRVAEQTGKTLATVSRVFHGKIEYSPDVQAALEEEIGKVWPTTREPAETAA